MSTHAITQTSNWDGTPPQVPDGGLNRMTNATAVIEAFVTLLANRTVSNHDAIALAAKLAGGNAFTGAQTIAGTGASHIAAIETLSGPHNQTGNTTNSWVLIWKGHTNRVTASQEMTVRLYAGDGLDAHHGVIALVANAHWDPSASAQCWVHENSTQHAACVMLTNDNVNGGLFVGVVPVQATGTTWTTWPTGDIIADTVTGNEFILGTPVSRTVPIHLRTASGALVGPSSFQSDGSFILDARLLAGLPGGTVDTLTARGTWWPIPIVDPAHEPIGTISVEYTSVYGGDVVRIVERTNELGTPAQVGRASYTTIAGTLVGTLSYTGNPGSSNSFYVQIVPATGTPDDSGATAGLVIKGISRSFTQTWLR